MNDFKLTFANNAHSKVWSERVLTLDEIRSLLHPDHRDLRKDKDGLCFVAATLLDGKRNAKSVNEVHLLVYDIDGAQTLAEVDALLDKFDHTAFLYTTHSHMAARTDVVVDHYEKWAKLNKKLIAPTLATMQEYLTAKGKGYLNNVRFEADWYERVADKGNIYYVLHDPVDKLRVIVPLASPINIGSLSPNNAKALDEYKSIYHGIGQILGFDFDPTCSDPCRLFYIPSCPPEMAEYSKSREYDGDLTDWTKYPRIAPTKKPAMETKAGTSDFSSEAAPYRPEQYTVAKGGRRINLMSWWKDNSFDFDIEALIHEQLNDQILSERGKGGYTITCPFEAEHTQPGGEGTFAANSDGMNPWTIHCSHASCQDAGRKKLDFLKGWIDLEMLPISALVANEQDDPEEERTTPSLEQIAADAGLNPDTMIGHQQEEIEEELSPVKDETNADELRTAVLADLKKAQYVSLVSRALARLDTYNLTHKDAPLAVTGQEFLELATDNGVSIKDLKSVYNVYRDEGFKDLPIEAFIEAVKLKRTEAKTIDDAVSHIISMAYSGITLNSEIERVANWYGVEGRYIRQLFRQMLGDTNKISLDRKLQEHYPKLSGQYARIMIGSSMEILDEKATREEGKLKSYKRTEFINFHESMRVNIEEVDKHGDKTQKRVQVVPHWLQDDVTIRAYNGVTFDPRQKNPASGGRFNLWNDKFYVEPMAGDPSPILNHIKEIWCDSSEELINWTMLYFADLFQRPESKPASAICLMGDEGSGKSIIFDKGFKPILGSMYIATSRREQLAGKFNKQAEGKLFWLAEESLFSGDRQHTDTLKDLITRDTMSIEPKTKDIYEVPNHIRYVFTSNRNHPLNLSSKDRRYFVLTTNNKYLQDTAYHERLSDWFTKSNGPAIWLNYIMNWKPEEHSLAWKDLYTPPMTKGKSYQIEMSRDAGEQFFVEIMRHGRVFTVDMSGAINAVHIEWPFDKEWFFISKARMQNAFNHYLKMKVGSKAQFEENHFNKLWEKFFINLPYEDEEHRPKPGQRKLGPDKKNTKVWLMGKRKDVIRAAVEAKLLHIDEYTEAKENPESHINLASQDNA